MAAKRIETDDLAVTRPKRAPAAPNPTDLHVGERTRLRRIELGMTQTELGRAVGLTLQQIQKYERGINRVCSSRLFDLSRALHVSVSYFFEGLDDGRVQRLESLVEGEVTDPTLRYETKELVRAYYGISDPNLRSQVWELAMALAPSV